MWRRRQRDEEASVKAQEPPYRDSIPQSGEERDDERPLPRREPFEFPPGRSANIRGIWTARNLND